MSKQTKLCVWYTISRYTAYRRRLQKATLWLRRTGDGCRRQHFGCVVEKPDRNRIIMCSCRMKKSSGHGHCVKELMVWLKRCAMYTCKHCQDTALIDTVWLLSTTVWVCATRWWGTLSRSDKEITLHTSDSTTSTCARQWPQVKSLQLGVCT